MVAAQGRHHRAAAVAGAHDRPAHRVPHVHEGERPRSVRAHALDRRTARPQGREIIADAAALLHRQRRFAQMRKDPAHVVRDGAHHKAVEQRDRAGAAGAGDDAARRQELEIGHRRVEPLGPRRGVAFGRGERRRHPPPGILDRLVDHLARGATSGDTSCPRSAAISSRREPWPRSSSLSAAVYHSSGFVRCGLSAPRGLR